MIPTFNNSIAVFHTSTSGGKTTWESVSTLGGISCYIEPLSSEKAMIYGLSKAYDSYTLYCDIQDIRDGDKLIDEQGKEYVVHGKQKYENNTDVDDHMEIVAYTDAF